MNHFTGRQRWSCTPVRCSVWSSTRSRCPAATYPSCTCPQSCSGESVRPARRVYLFWWRRHRFPGFSWPVTWPSAMNWLPNSRTPSLRARPAECSTPWSRCSASCSRCYTSGYWTRRVTGKPTYSWPSRWSLARFSPPPYRRICAGRPRNKKNRSSTDHPPLPNPNPYPLPHTHLRASQNLFGRLAYLANVFRFKLRYFTFWYRPAVFVGNYTYSTPGISKYH